MCRTAALVCLVASLFVKTGLAAGPIIKSVDPLRGPCGTKIKLQGEHLSGTNGVIFVVGNTLLDADFHVNSDTGLEVLAPEHYTAGDQGVIAVIGPGGAAVSVPRWSTEINGPEGNLRQPSPVFLVEKNGIVAAQQGLPVIEEGGVLTRIASAGAIFVKNGGALNLCNSSVVIFHEPMAMFGPNVAVNHQRHAVRFVQVPEINLCEGIEPFTFQAPEQSSDKASGPPTITGFLPQQVRAGQNLALQGKGFGGTTNVWMGNKLLPLAFRVVSDTELRVELPGVPGPQYVPSTNTATEIELLIQTPLGLALNVPVGPGGLPLKRMGHTFYHLAPREVLTTRYHTVYAEPDSIVASNSRMYLLKKGARLDGSQNYGVIFAEPGVVIPEPVAAQRDVTVIKVEQIVPSVLTRPLVLLP